MKHWDLGLVELTFVGEILFEIEINSTKIDQLITQNCSFSYCFLSFDKYLPINFRMIRGNLSTSNTW